MAKQENVLLVEGWAAKQEDEWLSMGDEGMRG